MRCSRNNLRSLMLRVFSFCLSALLCASLCAAPASQPSAAQSPALRFGQIFSDHMVLQRERPAPVWGWAAPNAKVTVSFGDASAAATAGADGRWSATLPAQRASKEPRALTASTDAAT